MFERVVPYGSLSTGEVSPIMIDQKVDITFRDVHEKVRGFARYLFLDLDLTCTDPVTHVMDTRFLRYLAKLESKKIVKAVPCTGRPVPCTTFLCRDSGLGVLTIASNGTSVVYPRDVDGKSYSTIERADQKGILQSVMSLIARKYGARFSRNWEHSQNTDVIISTSEVKDLPGLIKVFREDPEVRALVGERLGGISVTDSGSGVLHIHGQRYSKGKAIEALARAMNLDRSVLLYAGNGQNDLSARPHVGHFICVKNGLDAVKNVADYISEEDGATGTRQGLDRYLIGQGLSTAEQLANLWEQTR